jgi:hypothetical protein
MFTVTVNIPSGVNMESSRETIESENRKKLERLEEDRLKRFAKGLQSLPELDYDTVTGEASDLLKVFKSASNRELKRILSDAEARRPTDDDGDTEPED